MSSMSMNFEFKINSTGEILQKRGLESGGRVQQYVDNAVLRFCDPYVPKDTGMLIDSGITHTNIGSGTGKITDDTFLSEMYLDFGDNEIEITATAGNTEYELASVCYVDNNYGAVMI